MFMALMSVLSPASISIVKGSYFIVPPITVEAACFVTLVAVDSCSEPPIFTSIVASLKQQPYFVVIMATGLELSAVKASVEVQHFAAATIIEATKVFAQQDSFTVSSY